MFTVSLLTDPAGAPLDPALVEALRNAWGGGDVLWLNPRCAAEFGLAHAPQDFERHWAELQSMKTDLAIQPTANREKRLLIADMDSTMIRQECIDELADMAGVGAHVADITARAMNGELDFEEALRERVGLLKGLDRAVIGQVLRERITLMPGGATLLATMAARGHHSILVSGGFTDFAAEIARQLGFAEHRANVLLAEDETLSGLVQEPILGREAKVTALQETAAKLGLTPDDAIAVGDGANDLGMLQLAGTGVALHAKPAVAAQAKVRINHGDLSALLYLQGYASDTHVTA
ncbi:phosphoserine phosphatase SerB [Brevirhabdus pacifica]|uniref:Phosphoserine phosphatase n=1 Tax=Brevirhabdus pacifica TaxID=1267768 RepID=A0A1U7DJ64_9RHOB|nr:phosphoserine phosphatase SerB [Brevirhabdus pacifica]APX89939.1 phosphoserine phosphatase SerB [Brevirhabdus pacifica]OWU74335.1 phosphoserine phosphatase [Loktanella sp. 22II-4b]PJJ82831.1 phosphoserine phosphatase [Brevirhabdus pacifica]